MREDCVEIKAKDKSIITNNNAIIYILILAFVLRLILLITYGDNMYLYSDDVNYINSAINFLKTGHITYMYKNYETVSLMPGIVILMGSVFFLFGYAYNGIMILRLIYIFMSVITIYNIYRCGNILFKNKSISNIASFFFAISVSNIALSNIFLTETPALFCLSFFIVYTLKFCENRSDKYFVLMLIWYLICLLFKPTFGIAVIAFLPLMIYKKFSIKEMFIRGSVAFLVMCMFLSPWWIRNYKTIGEFIPFTGNQGDTLLLGTFQGENYPEGEFNEILEEINEKTNNQITNLGYWHPYLKNKEEGIVAKDRMKIWFKESPKDFVYSNFIYKPVHSLGRYYYPIEIFNINFKYINKIIKIEYFLCILGFLSTIFNVKKKKEQFFMSFGVILGIFLIVYTGSFYFSFARYAVTFIIVIKLFGALGLYNLCRYIYKFVIKFKSRLIQ